MSTSLAYAPLSGVASQSAAGPFAATASHPGLRSTAADDSPPSGESAPSHNGNSTASGDSASSAAANRTDSCSADSSPRSANGAPNFVRWQTLENLLLDGDGVQLFKMFLEGESNGHQLDFYFATDGYPKLFAKKDAASLRQLAKQIFNAFLRGERSIRLRPETRAALGERLRDEQPSRNMFDAAKRETIEFLREAHRAFLCSDVFISFVRDGATGGAQRDGTSTSDSDSHSCCSAASGCGSSECLSQIASGTASAGANQSQSGSVRASTYLPALPEDVDELVAAAAASNRAPAAEQLEEDVLDQNQQSRLPASTQVDDERSSLTHAPPQVQPEAQLSASGSAEPKAQSCAAQTPATPLSGAQRAGPGRSDVSLPSLPHSALHSEQQGAPQFDPLGVSLGLTVAQSPPLQLNATSSLAASQAQAQAQSSLKLNKENLRKTQLSRAAELSSAVFGPTHPAYMPAAANAAFSNRKPPNPYYTSYATVSTQDSELQSQSSDALNDDGSSLLTDNNADTQAHKRYKYQQQQQQQRHVRRMQQNRDTLQVLHVVPAPPAQIDVTERELSTKQPAVFAQRLTAKLQTYVDEQMKAERMSNIMNDPNSPANLTANLQKDDAALVFAGSLAPGAVRNAMTSGSAQINVPPVPRSLNSDAISRLASLTNRLAVDSEHQDAQEILEEHCSRVWEKSNELTPIRAASPPTGLPHANARGSSGRQSNRAYPTSATRTSQQNASAFQTLPFTAGFQQSVAYPSFQQQNSSNAYAHATGSGQAALLRGPPTSLATSSYEARDDSAAYGAYSRYQPVAHGQLQTGLYGSSGASQSQTAAAGPYSMSSYPAAAGYYHGPTSKSDTGCSDLSDAIVLTGPTSSVHGGPLRPLSESASTGSVVAISHITCASGSASSGIVSDYSLATTASGASRSHRKSSQSQQTASGRPAALDKLQLQQQLSSSNNYASSKRQAPPLSGNHTMPNAGTSQPAGQNSSALQQFVAQQSLNGRMDMPRQPFMSNPLMPPVPQPNTDTQIAEAARRLASSASRAESNDERSQTSSLPRQAGGAMQHAAAGAPTGDCTQVIYYLPNEKVPYRSTLPLRNVTLAQFRSNIIAKRDVLRCFFKKICDDVEAGVVFEEITQDDTVLPLFEGKIVARLERAE